MNGRGGRFACPFFVEGKVGLLQVEAAAAAPVTVYQAKDHVGVHSSETEWDALLLGFIQAATAHAELYLNKALGAQEWRLTLDGFADEITLPLGPVTAVAAITYLDTDRAEQTLDVGSYILDLVSVPQRIVRDPDASWPDTADVPNAVTVEFTTGYASVPANVTQAILQAVATWFYNREAGVFPEASLALLRPLRRIVI